jgi:hypothetical protein
MTKRTPIQLFRACALLLAFVAACTARSAVAQAQTSVPTPEVAFIITPLVADVGVARKLTVSGVASTSCPPLSATLDTRSSELTRTIVVRLLRLPTSVPCPPTPREYRFELAYVPIAKGITTVLAYTTTGGDSPASLSYLTSGRIVVAPVDSVWSSGDIGGAWYDPATNGSGLTFVHNYTGNDTVFGTWYLYDSEGKPRWYTLQEGKWKQDGEVVEGKLFESRGAPCPLVTLYCPTTIIGAAAEVGTFRATFKNLGNVVGGNVSAKIDAIAPNGAVLFSSNIQRLQF